MVRIFRFSDNNIDHLNTEILFDFLAKICVGLLIGAYLSKIERRTVFNHTDDKSAIFAGFFITPLIQNIHLQLEFTTGTSQQDCHLHNIVKKISLGSQLLFPHSKRYTLI